MKDLIDQDTIVDMLCRVTSDVMSTMLSLESRAQDPYKERQAPDGTHGLVSFVGLAGAECVGTGSLHCEADVACRLASSFLMTELTSVDDEVLDAFGELTNMIIGNFKTEVEAHMGPMGLSVPTVIHGRNFSTRSLGHEDWTVVPFMCGNDRLEVKVFLKNKQATTHLVRHGDRQEFILGQ